MIYKDSHGNQLFVNDFVIIRHNKVYEIGILKEISTTLVEFMGTFESINLLTEFVSVYKIEPSDGIFNLLDDAIKLIVDVPSHPKRELCEVDKEDYDHIQQLKQKYKLKLL